VFDAMSWASLLGLSVGMLLLFFIVMYSIKYCCRLLGFSAADEVTAMFCGSKKSLVHGTVMSRVLFDGTGAGMLLLPLMIYHALQLIAASIMAQKIAARNATTIE
jgi:sodium/bile acid cotransporter 7